LKYVKIPHFAGQVVEKDYIPGSMTTIACGCKFILSVAEGLRSGPACQQLILTQI